MGDATAQLVLGIEVTRTTFFVTTGRETLCLNGHKPTRTGAKFCDEDGTSFSQKAVEKATPDFEVWAKKIGYKDPVDLWDDLLGSEGHLAVLKKYRGSFVSELGIYDVSPVQSSIRDGAHYALGFKIMEQSDEKGVNGVDAHSVAEKGMFLNGLAKELGLESLLPVQFMLSLYWSV